MGLIVVVRFLGVAEFVVATFFTEFLFVDGFGRVGVLDDGCSLLYPLWYFLVVFGSEFYFFAGFEEGIVEASFGYAVAFLFEIPEIVEDLSLVAKFCAGGFFDLMNDAVFDPVEDYDVVNALFFFFSFVAGLAEVSSLANGIGGVFHL